MKKRQAMKILRYIFSGRRHPRLTQKRCKAAFRTIPEGRLVIAAILSRLSRNMTQKEAEAVRRLLR